MSFVSSDCNIVVEYDVPLYKNSSFFLAAVPCSNTYNPAM